MTPEEFIDTLDEPRRTQVQNLYDFIREEAPDYAPKMWNGMIGFGSFSYNTAAGKPGEFFRLGIGSNKASISFYCTSVNADHEYLAEKHKALFPKASVGKSCIRFRKFEDIELLAIKRMIEIERAQGR